MEHFIQCCVILITIFYYPLEVEISFFSRSVAVSCLPYTAFTVIILNFDFTVALYIDIFAAMCVGIAFICCISTLEIEDITWPRKVGVLLITDVTSYRHIRNNAILLVIFAELSLDIRTKIEIKVFRDKKLISSPKRPHQLWGPPSFLFNEY